jgi:hypothetical protein
MAIISWPEDTPLRPQETCAVCLQLRSLADLTAGFVDAQHGQLFACNDHFWHVSELIVGWADAVSSARATHEVQVGEGLERGGNVKCAIR